MTISTDFPFQIVCCENDSFFLRVKEVKKQNGTMFLLRCGVWRTAAVSHQGTAKFCWLHLWFFIAYTSYGPYKLIMSLFPSDMSSTVTVFSRTRPTATGWSTWERQEPKTALLKFLMSESRTVERMCFTSSPTIRHRKCPSKVECSCW